MKNNDIWGIFVGLKTGTVGVRNSFGIGLGQGRLAGKAGTLERMFCPR
jgi:hypothetical protein